MPRQARLDAPGVLHHVMVRGIERRRIFQDDADRADFCARLARVVTGTGLRVLAWALLPNHGHLLVRTGTRPLARCMRFHFRSRLAATAAAALGRPPELRRYEVLK